MHALRKALGLLSLGPFKAGRVYAQLVLRELVAIRRILVATLSSTFLKCSKVLKIVRDFQNGGFKGSLQKALYNAIVSCTKYEFNLTVCKRRRKWEI